MHAQKHFSVNLYPLLALHSGKMGIYLLPRDERSTIIESTCFNGHKICLKCGKPHIYQKSVGFLKNLSEEMPESQPHSVSPLTLQQWLLITQNTMKKRNKH